MAAKIHSIVYHIQCSSFSAAPLLCAAINSENLPFAAKSSSYVPVSLTEPAYVISHFKSTDSIDVNVLDINGIEENSDRQGTLVQHDDSSSE